MMIEDVIAPNIGYSAPPVDEAHEYSQLVNDGIIARQAMDKGRWVLGNNVRKLVTYYAQRTIEQYADDVGVEANRLYEYGELASFYPTEIREELSELDLCYTHYREAKTLKNLADAVDFLKLIALYRWNVSETRERLKLMRSTGHIDPTKSTGSTVKDLNNLPYERRPSYQWRGPATVQRGKDGTMNLKGVNAPEIEDGKRYIVSFEELED